MFFKRVMVIVGLCAVFFGSAIAADTAVLCLKYENGDGLLVGTGLIKYADDSVADESMPSEPGELQALLSQGYERQYQNVYQIHAFTFAGENLTPIDLPQRQIPFCLTHPGQKIMISNSDLPVLLLFFNDGVPQTMLSVGLLQHKEIAPPVWLQNRANQLNHMVCYQIDIPPLSELSQVSAQILSVLKRNNDGNMNFLLERSIGIKVGSLNPVLHIPEEYQGKIIIEEGFPMPMIFVESGVISRILVAVADEMLARQILDDFSPAFDNGTVFQDMRTCLEKKQSMESGILVSKDKQYRLVVGISPQSVLFDLRYNGAIVCN